jgi:hypothetical protein
MTGFEKIDNPSLALIVMQVKQGMLDVINMGDEALVSPGEKECPPAAGFWIKFGLLGQLEKEIARRGFNPSDPSFGPDLMTEIREIQNGL